MERTSTHYPAQQNIDLSTGSVIMEYLCHKISTPTAISLAKMLISMAIASRFWLWDSILTELLLTECSSSAHEMQQLCMRLLRSWLLSFSQTYSTSLSRSLSLSFSQEPSCPCEQDKHTYSRTARHQLQCSPACVVARVQRDTGSHTRTHTWSSWEMGARRLGASMDNAHQKHNNNQSRRTLLLPDRQFSSISWLRHRFLLSFTHTLSLLHTHTCTRTQMC